MALPFESVLSSAPDYPRQERPEKPREARLNITVVFTCVEATLHALREAATLASSLRGRVTLVVPQIVPYPLPLASPPVFVEWNERRFRLIASDAPVETRVMIYLCRDRVKALNAVLSPHSIVLIAGRRRWWPTSETWLAGRLRRAGHEVIFTQTE